MTQANNVDETDGEQTSHQPHVDDILQSLNPIGRYQILQTLVTCLVAFPAAFQLLDNVFIVRKVPHRCAVPANNSTFWDKYLDVENRTVKYDECQISILSYDDVIAKEPCINGIEFDWPVEYSVESQFNLVCDRKSLAKLSQTLVIGGQGVGAFLITIFSDRFGRKIALTGSNLGLLVCGVAIAFAPNFAAFAVFKFAVGGFQQGVLTTYYTLVVEIFKKQNRHVMAIVAGGLWTSALVVMPFIAYLFRFESWRYLHLTLTMSSLAVFFQMWYLDESLRWLIANGKTERALNWIKRAARYNKKDYNEIIKEFAISMEVVIDKGSNTSLDSAADKSVARNTDSAKGAGNDEKIIHLSAVKKMTFIDLLRTRRLLVNALSVWFAWFTVALGYFAIYLTATDLYGDPYINFALVSMFGFPGEVTFFLGAGRFGRKPILIFLYALMGVSVLVAAVSKHMEEYNEEVFGVVTLVASLLASVGSNGCFGGVFLYTPEMFPTNLRNHALGIASFMGRIGGMLAPFTSVLAEKAVWGPGVLIGGCSIVQCFLIGFFLPESKGRELPQTLDDLLAWYKGKKPVKKEDSEARDNTQL